MSEKTLRIIVGVAVLLVAAYALTAMVGGSTSADRDGTARTLVRALAGASKGLSLVRIVGPEPGDSVELVRGDDGTWTVNGRPADSAAVARLEEALEGARVGHLAATNPDNHKRLGVAADSTWRLELHRASRGDPVRLLVGNNGPSYPSAYVRLPDSDEVYVLLGNLVSAVRRPAAEWRDRIVVRVDTAAVRRVVVMRDEETYELQRDSARWVVGDAPADSVTVGDLLAELARLEAQAFVEDTVALGDGVTRSVVALGEAGDTLALVRIAPTEQSWTWRATAAGKAAAKGLGEDAFELSSWRVDRITPEKGKVAGGQ
ncbi:MAG: DUF4340 domain-containing protein [bacterium]|jgi:hypothetical protein|nr:MAG: hypothetical protein DIU52_05105 [bacterium]